MEHWTMPGEFKPDPKEALDAHGMSENQIPHKMVNDKPCLHCNICGLIFSPNKRTHYIARDTKGIVGEPKYYDAFDCPVCGRQIIVGERKRAAVDITDLMADESEGKKDEV